MLNHSPLPRPACARAAAPDPRLPHPWGRFLAHACALRLPHPRAPRFAHPCAPRSAVRIDARFGTAS